MSDVGGQRAMGLGWLGAFLVVALYGGLAVAVDLPTTTRNPFADGATYHLMGHSLASDGDLEYRREDLERAFRDYPDGPSGIFLKRGRDLAGRPDPDPARLYYGKAFIYPLAASPFVRVLGTNGFLVFNAFLLGLAFLLAFTFLHARSDAITSLLLASAFVFATVVPVYAVWIAPELFNFSIGVLAFFLWLYKRVAPEPTGRSWQWLRRPISDYAAAAVMGLLTFSKVTNALFVGPVAAWLAWRGQWRRAVGVLAVWGLVTAALFGANVAITGEWNYQGGDRRTCYDVYPFQQEGRGLEVCDPRARDQALGDVMFDPEVFWSNLSANLGYFVVGRHSGVAAYFFPAVFGVLALLVARGRRAPWQWLVLATLLAEGLAFVVTQPYTYFGSGGSVGNRYFMGAYGLAVFLLPPMRSRALAAVPWLVGAAFVGKLVLSPFATSVRPATAAMSGPLRLLPIELTNANDLPMNTERRERVIWYGDDPELADPGFQIYRLDDNAYLQELDKSFWVRGESRADMLVKTDRPMRRLQFRMLAGAVPTVVRIRLGDAQYEQALPAHGRAALVVDLPPGFPYKHDRPPESPVAYIWDVSISSSGGFTPVLVDDQSGDTRYLGVRIKPVLVE